MEVNEVIIEYINRVRTQKGLDAISATKDTELIGENSGLDSLDLAVLVTELEQQTGKDPFKDGFIMFRTVCELAGLYEKCSG